MKLCPRGVANLLCVLKRKQDYQIEREQVEFCYGALRVKVVDNNQPLVFSVFCSWRLLGGRSREKERNGHLGRSVYLHVFLYSFVWDERIVPFFPLTTQVFDFRRFGHAIYPFPNVPWEWETVIGHQRCFLLFPSLFVTQSSKWKSIISQSLITCLYWQRGKKWMRGKGSMRKIVTAFYK